MPPSLVLVRLAVVPRATARLPIVRLDHFFGDSSIGSLAAPKLHSRAHAVRNDQADAGQLKPSCFLGFLRRELFGRAGPVFHSRDHVEEEGGISPARGFLQQT